MVSGKRCLVSMYIFQSRAFETHTLDWDRRKSTEKERGRGLGVLGKIDGRAVRG